MRRIGSMGLPALVMVLLWATAVSDAFGAVTFEEFPLTPGAQPAGIVAGPNGSVWFTEVSRNALGELTVGGHLSEHLPGLPADAHPFGLTRGPDNRLWFTEPDRDAVAAYDVAHSTVTPAIALQSGAHPLSITSYAGDLWVGEFNGDALARVTTSGALSDNALQFNFQDLPFGLLDGPGGRLWVALNGGDRIVNYLPGSPSSVGSVNVAQRSGPSYLTTGPDGNVWFTENTTDPQHGSDAIGRVTPDGQLTEFTRGLTPNSGPAGITLGPDGNLWFTERTASRIGRITPDGTITEFPVPTQNSDPYQIITGPDAKLYFTERAADRIGRITITPPTPPACHTQQITVPGGGASTLRGLCDGPADGPVVRIRVTRAPYHGTAVPGGEAGSIDFTPDASYTGPDSMTVVATNPGGDSAPATINLIVTPSGPGGPQPQAALAPTSVNPAAGAMILRPMPSPGVPIVTYKYTVQPPTGPPESTTCPPQDPVATVIPNMAGAFTTTLTETAAQGATSSVTETAALSDSQLGTDPGIAALGRALSAAGARSAAVGAARLNLHLTQTPNFAVACAALQDAGIQAALTGDLNPAASDSANLRHALQGTCFHTWDAGHIHLQTKDNCIYVNRLVVTRYRVNTPGRHALTASAGADVKQFAQTVAAEAKAKGETVGQFITANGVDELVSATVYGPVQFDGLSILGPGKAVFDDNGQIRGVKRDAQGTDQDGNTATIPNFDMNRDLPPGDVEIGANGIEKFCTGLKQNSRYSIAGLPVEGKICVHLLAKSGDGAPDGTLYNITVGLPGVLGGIRGGVDLFYPPGGRARLDGLDLHPPDLSLLDFFGFSNTHLTFVRHPGQRPSEIWSGGGQINFPGNNYGIRAELEFDDGQVGRFSVDALLGSPGIPLSSGFFLDRIGFRAHLLDSDFGFGAGVGINYGGQILGCSLIHLDGEAFLQLRGDSDHEPGFYSTANLSTLCGLLKLARSHFTVTFNGTADAGGNVDISLHDLVDHYLGIGIVPDAAGSFHGSARFAFASHPHLAAQIDVGGGASVLGIEGDAELVISTHGFGVCFYVPAVGHIGGGVVFGQGGYFDSSSCNIDRYRAVNDSGTARSATAATRVRFRRGTSEGVLQITGAHGPPSVIITPPGGGPAMTSGPDVDAKGAHWLILKTTSASQTSVYIAHPKPGPYVITANPGSVITRVLEASALPDPTAHARVVGGVLRYTAKLGGGQDVHFYSQSLDGTRLDLGIARSAQGTMAVVDPRPRGRRKLIGIIERNGMPDRTLVLEHYRSPGPLLAGRPGPVRVTRSGKTLRVSWGAGVRDQHYVVTVSFDDGRTKRISTHARSLTVTHVSRRVGAVVAVRGSYAAKLGPPRTGVISGITPPSAPPIVSASLLA